MTERFEDNPPDGASISDEGGEMELTLRMSQEMFAKLVQNRGKTHWKHATIGYLKTRLLEEVLELLEASRTGKDIWAEAADVANFAAFIADNVETE